MEVVTRKKEEYGTTLTMVCACGEELETFVEKGAQVSQFPSSFPDDFECDSCGRCYNGSGQEINSRGSFDPDDAGERWDEDY